MRTTTADRIRTIALAAVCVASMLWLATHMGCAHPIGNTLALIAYTTTGTRLLLPYAAAALADAGVIPTERSDDDE